MKLKELITSITAILILFGMIFGVYKYIDTRYALAEEVKKVEKRLDYKILSDQYNAIQQRIWTIQDRFQKKPMDQTTTDELRKLEQGKGEIQNKMDKMEMTK